MRREALTGKRLVATAVLALSTVAFFRVALLPDIGSDLRLRPGLVGLVTVVFGVGRLLTDLPAGWLADRLPPLRALAGSGVVLGAGSLVLADARSLAVLLAAAALLGLGSSVTNTTGMTFFSRGPVAGRGTSLAIFSAALLGGQALGPGAAGLLAGAGWRVAETAAAAVAVAAGLACLAVRRPPASGAADGAAAATSGPPVPAGQVAILHAVAFSGFFALGAMPQTLLPLIGAHGYGLSTGAIGLLLGVGGLCRFAGAWIGGLVSDRRSRKAALVPSLVSMAAGAALLEVPGGRLVWLASVVLISVASFGVTVGATVLADLGGGVRVGRRLGAFRFAGDLGLIVGPLAAGWIYDALGTGAAVSAVAGVLGACALVVAVGLRETRHAEPAAALEPAL